MKDNSRSGLASSTTNASSPPRQTLADLRTLAGEALVHLALGVELILPRFALFVEKGDTLWMFATANMATPQAMLDFQDGHVFPEIAPLLQLIALSPLHTFIFFADAA
ncbi:hypothetical protein PIB30_078811 [Stylosanthes scabra]|uniref:Uncharacterized protein n=1 Tax=Stylosanthes scabra TaxID=79078 RepID=A0ABU6XPJ2_9FABA|nr:hypothetical protein [Stylosanthes scabra]